MICETYRQTELPTLCTLLKILVSTRLICRAAFKMTAAAVQEVKIQAWDLAMRHFAWSQVTPVESEISHLDEPQMMWIDGEQGLHR